LDLAALFGLHKATNALLQHGQNPNSKDSYGRTPLSYAAENGRDKVVELLLERRAEIESRDRIFDQTPLSWAAEKGHEAVVRLLLDKGADLGARDMLFTCWTRRTNRGTMCLGWSERPMFTRG
ncbi:ankyrin repeat-containing domain protein, partial [Lasiosphaeria ovina]